MLVSLLFARSAYKSPTKNNFTSLMKLSNVFTVPDVMLTSHSIPQVCRNVIIEHPFWGAAEQVVVLYVPRPFPSPRVAVKVGKGSGYARLGGGGCAEQDPRIHGEYNIFEDVRTSPEDRRIGIFLSSSFPD